MTKFSAAQQSQLAQIGAFLRENREVQGKSLEDIAMHTYIRPQLLNGIETGNPDLLPEPIFVQGFIRRYADNLGLKGIELSQQFTVNSIPSTPRPIRPLEMPESSSTKRITRQVATANGAANGSAVNGSTANGSSSSIANSTPSFTVSGFSAIGEPLLDDAGISPQSKQGDLSADIPLIIDDTEVESAISEPNIPEPNIPEPNISEPAADDIPIISGEFELASEALAPEELASEEPAASDDFSSKVAAFDQTNLEPHTTEAPVSLESSNLESSNLESFNLEEEDHTNSEDPGPENFELEDFGADNASPEPLQFNDELPAPPTAEIGSASASSSDDATPEIPPVATPATTPATTPELNIPNVAYSPEPVGAEIGSTDGPNLKLLAIGAVVVAAVVAGIVLIANMLGGGEQQPSVADAPGTTEQIEAPVEEPVVPTPPPVSSAPIYVEATATGEAWVSIIADDNNLLFEGTLNPGDTKLWEAQEKLSVYSGNAGALQLSQNGNAVEVMGAGGQPQEKIFTVE